MRDFIVDFEIHRILLGGEEVTVPDSFVKSAPVTAILFSANVPLMGFGSIVVTVSDLLGYVYHHLSPLSGHETGVRGLIH